MAQMRDNFQPVLWIGLSQRCSTPLKKNHKKWKGWLESLRYKCSGTWVSFLMVNITIKKTQFSLVQKFKLKISAWVWSQRQNINCTAVGYRTKCLFKSKWLSIRDFSVVFLSWQKQWAQNNKPKYSFSVVLWDRSKTEKKGGAVRQ